eukprot:TRINITY_DN4291_c0_g4_i2.p2 TRINITY_DN4291_c0_g4~~TRINITY_DN4291_c0_g4_i2.p2  ORF type:complete len:187 (-),score=3.64 TRINITY_DN4291_c0_g4_i2:299-784(-)
MYSLRASVCRPVAARPVVGRTSITIAPARQQHGLNVSNGGTVFAIRHGLKKAELGRPADQRKALIRALVTETLRHGRITTTKTRAKAIRKYVDRMISLAKDGSLHARRQCTSFVYDKSLVYALFEEVPKRYGDRDGGYCRVQPVIQRRRGDNAEMATIELV